MKTLNRSFARLFVAIASCLIIYADSSFAAPFVVDVEADTSIRTDLDVRRNDNYGKSNNILVGTSRGGGGIPFGGPDAMRSLLRFDLAEIATQATSAVLELTVSRFNEFPTVFEIGVYQVLEPWIEGNGCEGPFSTTNGCPLDSVFVDEAFGVAWEGIDINNEIQPVFDPVVITAAAFDTSVGSFSDILRLDITSLFNDWIDGTPNEGILLRDVTSDGTFRELAFGAKEDSSLNTGNIPRNAPASRIVVNVVPEPTTVGLLAIGLLGVFRSSKKHR